MTDRGSASSNLAFKLLLSTGSVSVPEQQMLANSQLMAIIHTGRNKTARFGCNLSAALRRDEAQDALRQSTFVHHAGQTLTPYQTERATSLGSKRPSGHRSGNDDACVFVCRESSRSLQPHSHRGLWLVTNHLVVAQPLASAHTKSNN